MQTMDITRCQYMEGIARGKISMAPISKTLGRNRYDSSRQDINA